MKKKLFYNIFLLMSLFSCERIMDNYWKEQERKNYTSPYMGTWTGTYTGDERGTFTLEVSKSGYMKRVTRTSGTFMKNKAWAVCCMMGHYSRYIREILNL